MMTLRSAIRSQCDDDIRVLGITTGLRVRCERNSSRRIQQEADKKMHNFTHFSSDFLTFQINELTLPPSRQIRYWSPQLSSFLGQECPAVADCSFRFVRSVLYAGEASISDAVLLFAEHINRAAATPF